MSVLPLYAIAFSNFSFHNSSCLQSKVFGVPIDLSWYAFAHALVSLATNSLWQGCAVVYVETVFKQISQKSQ